ncbi:MAG: ral bacterial porin, family [Paraburkholderia sp.]|nr:ral bacterial porin, family [Paraburkholderia sp.]
MKKTLLVGALTGVFATMAHAQSSVTLYGLLDAGISYSNSASSPQGRSLVQMSNGMMQSNRWGLRGAEDLGGGLKAIFVLENGFNLTSGKLAQGGREFGRNAYAGLSSSTYGTVTLGRQNEFMYDYVSRMGMSNSNGTGGNLFAHVMDNDNLIGSGLGRINNAVKYTSTNFSGLTVAGLYGFSNQAGAFANDRAYSLGATYSNGPINAALAYTQVNNGNAALNSGGAVDANTTTADSSFTAQRVRIFGGGLNYTFGPANVGFVITDTKLNAAIGFSSTGTPLSTANAAYVHFTNYEVNAHYSLTPALTLGAAYTYTQGKFVNATNSVSPTWNQFGLLADYALSKRTDVYTGATYNHLNGGMAKGATGGAVQFEGASSYIGGTGSASNQVVVGVGMRTRF